MQTKLSNSSLLQGYMTILRSAPNQIASAPAVSVMGLVSGSSSPRCRGIKNRNAAFPDGKSAISLMADLVVDCRVLALHCRLPLNLTHVDTISSDHHISLHAPAVSKLYRPSLRIHADDLACNM